MTIRRLLQALSAGLVVLATLAAALIVLAATRRRHLVELEGQRLRSYQLADELRHTSDDLTRFVRSYVATGDPRYEQYYRQVLAIRNGQAPRPEHYEGVYWDLYLGQHHAPRPAGPPRSLLSLMQEAGFTADELDQLRLATASSDSLTAIENAAFTAMAGPSPNRTLALRLVNDSAYDHAKAVIMKPIDDFLGLVEARTAAALDDFNRQTRVAFVTIESVFVLVLLVAFGVYPLLRRRILVPVSALRQQTAVVAGDLDRLAYVTQRIADGDLGQVFATSPTPVLPYRSDEIGDLSRTHDAMLVQLQSTGAAVAVMTATLARANEALDAHLRRTLDLASMGTFTIDRARRTITMSAQMAALFRVGTEPVVLSLEEYRDRFYHPDDRSSAEATAERAYARKEGLIFDARVVRGDRKVIWVRASSAVERNDRGEEVVAGVVQDITARKEAEDDMRRSHQELADLASRFASMFRDSPVALTVTEADTGTVREANSRFVTLVGAESLDQVLGRTTLELGIYGGDAGIRRQAIAFVEPRNRVKTSVLPLRLPSGEARTIEAMSSWYDVDGQRFILASMIDVTDRLRAQADRLRAEQQYRELFDGMRDIVFSLTREGVITILNPAFEATTGLAPADWIGHPYVELVHPDDRPRTLEQLEAALAGRPLDAPPLRLQSSKGWLLAEFRSSPRIEDGKTVGIFGIARDVSERVSLEQQLRQAQKMEALGTLAGGIAHDFNNILTAINGNAELALAETGADGGVRESLQEIREAGGRAKDLVRRILIFSRRQEVRREVIDLVPVVEEALKLLRTSLPKTITVTDRAPADLPLVSADATQIHQIIMNLGTNAGHAMGDRGSLTVELDQIAVTETDSPSAGLRPGPYVRLTVLDTGVGMSAEILARIFEPFFTTKGDGGTGLGLSVVHGIMRDHEGAITVQSALGQGTAFHLYFPAAEAPAAQAESARAALPLGRGQRIMVVDDEEGLVFLMTRILNRLGYRGTGFTNPHDALQAFRTTPAGFDAVITDLSMPLMNGLELVRELREIRSDIPIALASGRTDDNERASQAGVQIFLQKPATIEEIAEAVDRLSGRG